MKEETNRYSSRLTIRFCRRMPSSPWTLGRSQPDSSVWPAGGSCSVGLKVSQVKIEGKLAKDAQQWREQMLYRTIVDGEINWIASGSNCVTIPPGRSWQPVGHDQIFAACRKLSELHYVEYDLAPARHTLKMQAFLPGTDVVLETDVKLVDLYCTWRK